jgi:peroxiredoxin
MVLLFSFGCLNNNYDLIISGEVVGLENKDITLEKISNNRINALITSKTDKNGAFEIKLKELDNGFYRLSTIDNIIFLSLKKGDRIEIKASFPNISRNYTIDGSHDSQLLREMNHKLLEYSDFATNLRQEAVDVQLTPNYNIDSLTCSIEQRANDMYKSARKYLENFIDNNQKSPAIYMVIHQYINSNPIFSIERDFNIYEKVLDNLKMHNPNLEQIGILEVIVSNHKLNLKEKENNYKNISIGSKAPDFNVYNDKNELVSLNCNKGERIILYFWASWSKVSTQNMELLKDIKSKHENIKIITISLDTDENSWKSALNSLEIKNFTNLCDFKVWESPIINEYSITNIPTFVIINELGIIEFVCRDYQVFGKELDNILIATDS